MRPVKLAVLVSGGGTTLQYIIDEIEAGRLNASVRVVVSSRRDAYALKRAEKHNIPRRAVDRGDFKGCCENELEKFNSAILNTIKPYGVDLVALAGFMSLLTPEFVREYPNRIMNTHPALIPSFCGDRMYGDRVHRAVLEYGVRITGCTIHFVDEQYDHGPVILQRAVPVHDDDTLETLRARVMAEEKKLYCEAIRLFGEGRLEIEGRKVRIKKF
ncbi:MAG: phosphoribosylglycinamide formyltransferase [bacterium]